MAILIAIFLPLIGAFIMPVLGRRLGQRTALAALPFALISAGCVAALAPQAHEAPVHSWAWAPSIGLSLSFLADGLSVFFGLVVSLMGVLVIIYGAGYLDDHHYRDHGRFYAYLLLFMSSMLGTVFADHLLLLFIFWELTGISSFLLIGFNHEKGESREGARMALLITGATGLAMLAGIVLLGQVTGTLSLKEILAGPLPPEVSGTANVIMLLMMLGAFGKSAQFPFQFWLPNAMAAPTPVSAYLHSATMVKLGVFLSARMFPVFHHCDWWMPLVTVVAFGTMLFGAVLAFLAVDLKAILAFSTVSQLGFLIGYYGLAPEPGVDFDYLHILNHVFYKGCLFMVAGIVDHATGTRDIRLLGGLWRRTRLLGIVTLLACMAMAGLPGTTGFVSKEYMLKEIFGSFRDHDVLGWYALILVVLTSLIKVAFSVRLFHGIFLGPETEAVSKHYHAPPVIMLIPPLLLAAAAVFFGIFPPLLGQGLAILEVDGLHNRAHGELSLWHGVTAELFTSMAIAALGLITYTVVYRLHLNAHRIPDVLLFERLYDRLMHAFNRFTKGLTGFLRADQPLDYLPILAGFIVLTVGGVLATVAAPLGAGLLVGAAPDTMRSAAALLITLAVLGVIVLPRGTTQLICLSVAGFFISFYYVLYRAPDLALTQLLVETVTLILVILLLSRFPRSAEKGTREPRLGGVRRLVNAVLSVSVGALMTGLVLLFSRPGPGERVGALVLEQTLPLAEGSNAVNTILVDFRGLDTLGEIAVLAIATLGCLGLLMRYKRSRAEYRRGALGPAGFGIDHDRKEDEP